MENFDGLKGSGLPSAPPHMIVVNRDPFRPQPRLDRDTYDGMATVVGRIRKDSVLKNGINICWYRIIPRWALPKVPYWWLNS